MEKKIRVLYVRPNELPEEIVISNTLNSKRKLVEGNIEYTYRDYYPGVIFICNEEGKIRGLPYNRDIGGDVIAGSFLIVGDDSELGEDKSLTKSQIKKYKKIFDENSIEQTRKYLKEVFDLEI